MGLREIIISILCMALVVVVFSTFLADTSSKYGTDLENETWQNDFVDISKIENITDSQSKTLEESGTNTDEFEPNVGSITATAKLVLETKSILSKMFNSLADLLKIAPLPLAIILSIFAVIVTASVASVLWKWRL